MKHEYELYSTCFDCNITTNRLEGYQYSRLNQNELEVDSVVFYSDPLDDGRSHTMVPTQTEEDQVSTS